MTALRGFIPISAGYDFIEGESAGYARSRFSDERELQTASPLHNIREPAGKALVAVGSREEGYLDASRTFVSALEANGVGSDLLVLDDTGHDGTALSLGDEQSELSRAILRLMNS